MQRNFEPCENRWKRGREVNWRTCQVVIYEAFIQGDWKLPNTSAAACMTCTSNPVVFGRPQSVNFTASAAGAATALGDVSAQLGVPSGAPLEDRVRVLEENFSILRGEVRLNKQTLRNEVGAVRSEIERETQGRQADSQRLTRRLEEVAIGGLHLEIVGLLWLVVGVLATSIPDELVSLFGRK